MRSTYFPADKSSVSRVVAAILLVYCVLWALTGIRGTRAVRSVVATGLHVDKSFTELTTTDQVRKASGHAYAIQSLSYAPCLVTVAWARSDENYATCETELYVWFGFPIHVHSFKSSGWTHEYPNKRKDPEG
jgi:hypothetical protein